MEILGKLFFDFTLGAMGYLLRKWYGEELSKYIFIPVSKQIKKYTLRPVQRWVKRRFVKTEYDGVAWVHYKHRARKQGHDQPDVYLCQDGLCSRF